VKYPAFRMLLMEMDALLCVELRHLNFHTSCALIFKRLEHALVLLV